MALRWVRRLGLWLAVVGLGNIAGVAAEGPSPEVAALQKRYLDRYFLLRVDVKIQKADVNRILASTVPPPPKLEALHSTTVITPDGVFYTRDYAQTTEVNADVRPGIDVRGDAQPGDATRQDGSGMTGDVLEIKRESVAVLEQEDLARVIGIEEVAHGYLLTVEGFSAQPVEVDLRVKGAKASAATPETGFDELFGQLVYLLPEDPEALAAWIDPIWPESVVGLYYITPPSRVYKGVGQTFTTFGSGTQTRTWRDNPRKGEVIEVESNGDEKIINTDAGYVITAAST